MPKILLFSRKNVGTLKIFLKITIINDNYSDIYNLAGWQDII